MFASISLLLAAATTAPATPPPATTAVPGLAEILAAADDRRAHALATQLAGQTVPEDLSQQLHQAVVRSAHPAGLATLQVALEGGKKRAVAVRVPANYNPQRTWPLLLVWHWSGGTAAEAIAAAERQLGPAIEEWVVAAPHDYRQTGLDAPAPFLDEHPRTLHALREVFHLDADRTVGLGWSLGGYTAWTWALLHGEELAAAIALAATTSTPPDEGGLWQAVAPNAAPVPVLTAWGSRDRLSVNALGGDRAGSVLELNRQIRGELGENPTYERWSWLEIEGRGHGILELEPEQLAPWLARSRATSPNEVSRRFRHLHQGVVWWLTATSLGEPLWGEDMPKAKRQPGESKLAALGREIHGRLPYLAGKRVIETDGVERISVETHLIDGLAVQFECASLREPRMVVLEVDGAEVFRGTVSPSLPLALLEARRTLDFERLTCGLLVRPGRGQDWRIVGE